MLISEILVHYSEEDLHRLARDKMDEVANLRLPREVLTQEIAAALSSLSYVARVLAPARPPTYAFLKLLLEAPEQRIRPHDFRQRVLDLRDSLSRRAQEGEGLSTDKNYSLYLRILLAAWEDDGRVDRSEALILAALRKELGIWMREHLLLEHHPMVRPVWDSERSYSEARNHLLATGIVLVYDGDYILPDEVAVQIRRHWEIELADAPYERLLDRLNVKQLHAILEAAALPVSGSKEERIQRIVQGLVPPVEALDILHINEVKDVCRECVLPVSAAKAELIASLIDHFDDEHDLVVEGHDDVEAVEKEPEKPEPRELEPEELRRLLDHLTVDLLYDVLTARQLRRSGSKAERIERLVLAPWSEATMLSDLRRTDLVDLCRKLEIPVTGVKSELIDRLIEWARRPDAATAEERREESIAEQVADLPEASPDEAAAEAGSSTVHGDIARPAPEEPSHLPWVQERYPDLDPDEQVVLAILRDARSLNEREIDRAARLHDLGWFLTKGHMADLVAKLRRGERCPIALRSAGQHNIYEWSEPERVGDELELSRQASRNLVDALRQGVVPDRHLERLVVGQEKARHHLTELLGHVAQGHSEFKFLRGAYGAGKTFLCSWLREQAFDRGFAVSTVRIGPDQPLSDLPVFFAALIDGLRTPEKRNATALADLLESWLLAIHRRTARTEGLTALEASKRDRLEGLVKSRIEEDLSALSDRDPGFGPAVAAFYRARLAGDHTTASTALAWLRGSRSYSAQTLASLGVRGHLSAEEVFPRMRALLQVIAGSSLGGLLLVVDELELVRRFPRARQRERAYETLRLLIDECGENGLPGCLLVCTGTDQFFEDDQYGLTSYRALAHRVSAPRTTRGEPSVRQPVIALEPLHRDRLLDVSLRVRDIHARAYDWPAPARVSRSVLERLADQWTRFGEGHTGRLPRPFLREVVHLLDQCEEHPELTAESFVPEITAPADVAASVLDVLEAD